MRRYSGSITVDTTVEVDIADVIYGMDEAQLRDALEAKQKHPVDEDDLFVRRAYDALLRNRPNEAFSYLHMELFPTRGPRWKR